MTFYDKIRSIGEELWLAPLGKIFSRMDAAYEKVASAYGFHCRGCEDNCCYTRFYHHTLLEYLFLRKGLETLDAETLDAVRENAGDVASRTRDAKKSGLIPRIMCPLNRDGLCLLYDYRPMICRLHGMAHELKKPGQDPVRSEGCGLFTEQTKTMDYIPFDRTGFYTDMAMLERSLRQASGVMDRLRHTIAEMILL
jgi:Fe-S-cluster containining protein